MIKYSLFPNGKNLEISLHGDLDIDSTEVIEEELIPAMEKYKTVKVNFGNVPFVDSSGMGLLMDLVHTLNDKGTIVTVSDVSDEVMQVFQLLQLPEILGQQVFV
ncbi:STAS domain-containing protein [Neobacillus sp. PS3-34]|uniref:STAS domain-containing protein n=1 Tax=Neobacillus sp. PS3-34 TaxID=3070678 RepID=UPI0027E0F4BA|nr:STAS domain-containing protein [Neobacillus sp. PS3-34]WML49523.1 STAS domain-containing protein [Neobacillus sp. PS3-34]